MAPQPQPAEGKLGIVAGGGVLPHHLIAACRAVGREVYVLALEGQADPALTKGVLHDWNRLGAVGGGIGKLRANGVRDLVFAGRVKRPSLAALRPDRKALSILATVAGGFAAGDNALLVAVTRALEGEGFRIVGAEEILEGLLAVEGPYGAYRPDDADDADIARGIAAARELGRADKGQAAVVRAGVVLGLEDEAGTDALLSRCAASDGGGTGGVLVKVAKPGQERRVDLPTIGPDTVENAARAGLSGIAVEAGGALVLDRAEVARRADAVGLFVVGIACR
jgi:DUF1009 family protein